jgi:Skp family chaperone for outer membrane proteins
MKLKRFCTCLFLFLLCLSSVFAQSEKKPESYVVGEKLVYEAKFSKAVLRGIAVADLSFIVESVPNSQNFLIKAEAKSKGTAAKLLNYRVYQNIQSTVDDKDFSILKTIKRDEQKERIRNSTAVFNYKNREVTYIESDPNDTARAPRIVASNIEKGVQDMVSGIYTLRRLPLAVGKTFEISISDSGLVYKVPVRVTAREEIKSILGKTWCFRVEPQIFGDNRLIEQKGSMIIWVTDDARRLPVRSQINSNIGRVEVKLKSLDYNSTAPIKVK